MAEAATVQDSFPVGGDVEERRIWFAHQMKGMRVPSRTLLAGRAALRALPMLHPLASAKMPGKNKSQSGTNLILPVFRAMFLSAVAPLAPTGETARWQDSVADPAAHSAESARWHDSAYYAAYSAAFSADSAAYSAAGPTAPYAAFSAAYSTVSADSAISAAAFDSDCTRLRSSGALASRRILAASPLWPQGMPPEVEKEWTAFSAELRGMGDGWFVWAEWYDGILAGAQNGSFLFGLPTDRALKLWQDVALIDDAIWEAGPAKLNVEFRRLVEEAKGSQSNSAPVIPTVRPAAVEPVWQNRKLDFPDAPEKPDGDKGNVAAGFRAAKAAFNRLTADLQEEANIDRRAIQMVRQVGEMIPEGIPSQFDLHQLAIEEEQLRDYQGTVASEWPETLKNRYKASVGHLRKALWQFPDLREFTRNASETNLSNEQLQAIRNVAPAIIELVNAPEAKAFMTEAIPEAAGKMAEEIASVQESWQEYLERSNDLLLYDFLEGFNNILKMAAVPMVGVKDWASDTASSSTSIYAREAKKSIEQLAKRAGKGTGPIIEKFFRRLFKVGLYGAAGGAALKGGAALGPYLIEKIPGMFKWLEGIARWL